MSNTANDVTFSNLRIPNDLGVGVYHGGGRVSNGENLNMIASTIGGNRATGKTLNGLRRAPEDQ